MAGSGYVTPNMAIEYVAKADPAFGFVLTSDGTTPVNLTGATLTAYLLNLESGSSPTPVTMHGAFTVTNAGAGQASYQWTLIDVNVPGGFRMYINAKLPGEPYPREFGPVQVLVLPTPEYWGGTYVQEVDLNVGGAPNTAANPTYTDVIDRAARALGHVIIDSLPAITGHVTPQIGGNDASLANPVPVEWSQLGEVAPWNGNPGGTTANTSTAYKWGSGGTTVVRAFAIGNETGEDVYYRTHNTDNAVTTGTGFKIKDGTAVFIAQKTDVLYFIEANAHSFNVAGGIKVWGFV